MLNQFERDSLFELTVGAFAEENLAHAAVTNGTHDSEPSDLLGQAGGGEGLCVFQEWRRDLDCR
jgi:hypothetical protein